MCLIVDANAAGKFLGRSSAILDWLFRGKGNPRLVAGGKLSDELNRLVEVSLVLINLERAGKLRKFDRKSIDSEAKKLKRCRSNDTHILALAILSGARTLASFDDALCADFRDPSIVPKRPKGRIYRDPAKHAHLLGHTSQSCGIKSK